jgi:hypothetical protein
MKIIYKSYFLEFFMWEVSRFLESVEEISQIFNILQFWLIIHKTAFSVEYCGSHLNETGVPWAARMKVENFKHPFIIYTVVSIFGHLWLTDLMFFLQNICSKWQKVLSKLPGYNGNIIQ